MTIIVGVVRNGEVAIAADTCTSFGSLNMTSDNIVDPKLHQVGEAWIGGAGWGTYGTVLSEYGPQHRKALLRTQGEVYRFFLDFWHALQRDYQYVNTQGDNRDSPWGQFDNSFIVASPGGLFGVSSSISVSAFQRYWAIGSGQEYALGAVHAMAGVEASASEVATAAAEAAIAHDDGCGGPVDVRTVRLADA